MSSAQQVLTNQANKLRRLEQERNAAIEQARKAAENLRERNAALSNAQQRGANTNSIRAQLQNAQTRAQEAQNELGRSRALTVGKQKEIQSIKTNLAKSKEQSTKLLEALNRKNAETKRLQSNLNAARTHAENAARTLAAKNAALENARQKGNRVNAAERNAANARANAEKKAAALANATQKAKDQGALSAQLQNQLGATQASLTRATNAHQTLTQERNAAQKQAANAEKRVRSMMNQLRIASNSLSSKNRNLTRLAANKSATQQQFTNARTAANAAQQVVAQLKINLNLSRKERDIIGQNLQRQIEQLQSSVTSQQSEHANRVRTLEAEKSTAQRNKIQLKAALNNTERRLQNANARAENLSRRRNASNAIKTAALRALTNAQISHQQALNAARGNLNAAQVNAARRIQIQTTEHRQELERRNAETAELQASLTNATRNRNQARTAATATTQERNQARAGWQASYEAFKQRNQVLRQRNQELARLTESGQATQAQLVNAQAQATTALENAQRAQEGLAQATEALNAQARLSQNQRNQLNALNRQMQNHQRAHQAAMNLAAAQAEVRRVTNLGRVHINKAVLGERANQLQRQLNNLRRNPTPQAAAAVAATAQTAAQTTTNTNTRRTLRNLLNSMRRLSNNFRRTGQGTGGMPHVIQHFYGPGGGGNGGGGGGPPPPGPGPGAGGGAPNSNANAERKKKLNLARSKRNLMYNLLNRVDRGQIEETSMANRFNKNEDLKFMANTLRNQPNAQNTKYRIATLRMAKILAGTQGSMTKSKLLYEQTKKLLRNLNSAQNKGPVRYALRTLHESNGWGVMKTNMKYSQDPEVKRTLNRVNLEIKALVGRSVNKFGRAVVKGLTMNNRLTIQQRINKLKKNYTLAATQNQRNTIKQELNQLKTSLETIKNKTSTPSAGNFNGNFNKASSEAERVDRIRALTQLLKKYPEQRAKIQAEITRTIRKIYRDPPYGTKNTNIRYNLEDVKRLIGGRSTNINREIAQGLQRVVKPTNRGTTSSSSSSNYSNLLRRLPPPPTGGGGGGGGGFPLLGAAPPAMMMGAQPPAGPAGGISLRVNAAPREAVQAATHALPPMERFALENVGGVKKAANIINNAGGPLVIQKAARILEKNKGNVVRAMKTTGLSRRVFANVEKLGGPKKVTRVIRATKKVAKKTTAAKKKSIAPISGKTKKKVLSSRSKKVKKVTITERRLKTLIAQIPKKSLEKNVLRCALP